MSLILSYIQSILLIISAILIFIVGVGILRLDDDLDNIEYAKLHILGILDMACILALLALNQVLIAILYFLVTPFVAHAIANAYYYSEDEINNTCGDNDD
ncbi:cation:proton antiporter [Methanobrevibacter sp. 87.7]|uniref:monovalent cation/H(+) antiporter subunit G n=1 Tax=Methanobrevibacter sp. 87.7 TaxID=387957 RepID=UPI000B5050E7|nr:monovalent cation/H(+) antiporter subunit G [Methanobrevibacter sp. 87.7]OWT33140.1 cation:proton antiporter [Methanobrevibacter sp. 87.7]